MRLVFIAWLFGLTMISQQAFTQDTAFQRQLMGKWIGIDENKDFGSLDFIDASKVIITAKTTNLSGTWQLQGTKSPFTLQIALSLNNQTRILFTTVELVGKNNLHWKIFASKEDISAGKPLDGIMLKRKP